MQLSALHFRPDWSLSANISGGKGQFRCSGKTRDILVSYGVEILTDDFVLSQYTDLTDTQTDGRTDGQNFDSNTACCITCSRTVKNGRLALNIRNVTIR